MKNLETRIATREEIMEVRNQILRAKQIKAALKKIYNLNTEDQSQNETIVLPQLAKLPRAS